MQQSGLIGKAGGFINKNSSVLLTGLGVAGMFTTTVLAVKATPRALRIIEADDITEKKDIIKAVWTCYLPSLAMGGMSMLCIISGHSVNVKRNAALASVYSLTDKSLREYQAKVIETFGENKEQKVRDDISEDRLKNNPVSKSEVIITGKGPMLCYEALSGRYFQSDVETVKQAVNRINRLLVTDTYRFVTLNDMYYELDLSNTRLGDLMGWHIDDGEIDIHFSSHLAEDQTPCLVINFDIEPKYIDFD